MNVDPKSPLKVGTNTSGSLLKVARPDNVVAGDILIGFLRSQSQSTTDASSSSGFSRVGVPFNSTVGGRITGVFLKVATASEPLEYNFTAPSRSLVILGVWDGTLVSAEVSGYSTDYRGVWDPEFPGRRMPAYGVSAPSLSFFFAASETTDGYSNVPNPPPVNYTKLLETQTGTGTSGSRTIAWLGAYETLLSDAPSDAISYAGPSAEVAQGISFKLITDDTGPEPGGDREVATGSITSGDILIIDKPTNTAVGDTMVAFIRAQGANVPDVDPPDGWAKAGTPYDGSTGGRVMSAWVKTAGVGEPASYAFKVKARALGVIQSFDPNVVGATIKGYANSYRGVWDNDVPGRRQEGYSANGPVVQFVFAGSEMLDGSSHVPVNTPEGFDTIANIQTGEGTTGSRSMLWVGMKVRPSNGESIAVGLAEGVSGEAVQSFALEYTAIPEEESGVFFDGNGRPVHIYEWDGNRAIEVQEYHILRPGFRDISHMLSVPGFTWAHRGLSTFAEESLYAYTRAALRGHGLLEYSMGRTSDGVYVGTHDNNLNRLTGRSDLPSINNMTWAEVQALQIVLGQGAPRPFSRVEDIIEAYGDSHMLMFDLKNYAWDKNLTDFLELISPLPKNRVMFKHIITATDHAAFVAAEGYSRWGYAYQATYNEADVDAMQTYWDFVGMEHSADQATWDRMKAYNKPIVGHIATTQAHYDACMTKGAIGVQTTGYIVEPVSWWNT